ncbi:serine/threonine protein kinase [Paenibacillus sp. 481]|uniref:serine/threonine protein kinase n=1 Tax=Paenibacillus sp. 481 TaxID=2835869 RepID=UPI001E4D4ED7|nr:serine/threonine-protein kinase [Paenibacillus sp. 481]UHA73102.1 serine/threonine protein kinase [Paenibacillus sp. 481]
MSQLTPTLPAGKLLHGRYRIEHCIGAGGMSTVYLAHDERLMGKRWAVKISKPSPNEVSHLMHEARLLTALRHPNLPLIVDLFPPDEYGLAYMVMEYVEGESLAETMKRGPVPFAKALHYGIQLCNALSYLHRQQPPIVFRDVKPSNVMITWQDDVKLIDFGIARNVKEGAVADTVKLGTIGFAAPEQYTGDQSDARTDLYGIGALLSHMLTGGRWQGAEPLRIRLLQADVPQSFGHVLLKLLAERPEDRYTDADELKLELLSFGGSESNTRISNVIEDESASVQRFRGIRSTAMNVGEKATVIAFASAGRGLGCTHAALLTAYSLSQARNGKVVYVDAGTRDGLVISQLRADYEGEPSAVAAARERLYGVTMMAWGSEPSFVPILQAEFHFIVLDLGLLGTEERISEFMRAHAPVLICSTMPWRKDETYGIVEQFQARGWKGWLLAAPHGSCHRQVNKREDLQWSAAKMCNDLRVVLIPTCARPFEFTESEEWLAQLLGTTKNKRVWTDWFRTVHEWFRKR